jgi:PleD family two-component response regulator
LEQAYSLLEAFRVRLSEYDFVINGDVFAITVSIGLTKFQNVTLTSAMRLADKALYQAKEQSRDCVVRQS